MDPSPRNRGFSNRKIHTSQVGVQLDQDVQVDVVGLLSSSVRDSDVLLLGVIFTHGCVCEEEWIPVFFFQVMEMEVREVRKFSGAHT